MTSLLDDLLANIGEARGAQASRVKFAKGDSRWDVDQEEASFRAKRNKFLRTKGSRARQVVKGKNIAILRGRKLKENSGLSMGVAHRVWDENARYHKSKKRLKELREPEATPTAQVEFAPVVGAVGAVVRGGASMLGRGAAAVGRKAAPVIKKKATEYATAKAQEKLPDLLQKGLDTGKKMAAKQSMLRKKPADQYGDAMESIRERMDRILEARIDKGMSAPQKKVMRGMRKELYTKPAARKHVSREVARRDAASGRTEPLKTAIMRDPVVAYKRGKQLIAKGKKKD